jgi:arylsulfatase A-like enzyme
LQAKHDKPFLAYLPYTLPHADVIAPHDSVYNYYIKKFNKQPLTQRLSNNTNAKKTFEPCPHAAFAAMVSRLDKYVGEIIATLTATGAIDNTLVIFTSDNGPHRENGGDPDFFKGNGNFRGIKRDLYEGGIRVPFIAYWKNKIRPGVSDQTGAFWDLYPTFLQMASVAVTKKIDGISILPSLLQNGKQEQHEYFYWEFHENNGRQAVRWKNWKGVKLNVSKNVHAPLELYDLSIDPDEKNNVAEKYPVIVKKIEDIMHEAYIPAKDWPLLATEIK